jgi:hypothetical protein
MRKTYENAAKVLVLDSELEAASAKAHAEEVLIRITCSGWMRRLWTLQEGALTRILLFQFKERAIGLKRLENAVMGDACSLLSSPGVNGRCWLLWLISEFQGPERDASVGTCKSVAVA